MNKPKVAIVYDRVNKFGGAERVLTALHQIYPDAPLYTLVHNKSTASWSEIFTIKTTFADRFPYLKTRHELLAPITPLAFESLNFDKYDLVISVTSADAKAIMTKPKTLHICICLTPTRYLWSGFDEYKDDWKMKLVPKSILSFLRKTDLVESSRPDFYIAISKEIQKRIWDYYQRDSQVVYPAIEDKFFGKPKLARKNYLLVGRLVPYKKAELVIQTFNKNGLPLVVVGTGSQEKYLKSIAAKNITFKGMISDDKLIEEYSQAIALIFPQFEDFGLIPIEAQACGTPVIAFAKGGALETIVDHKSGIFFSEQTPQALQKALDDFENEKTITSQNCINQAKKFTNNSFTNNFRDTVESFQEKYYKLYKR